MNSLDKLHPAFEERIVLLRKQIGETTDEDQREHVLRFTEEYDTIARSTGSMAFQALKRAIAEAQGSRRSPRPPEPPR
jgi:hypothetical protein